MDLEYLKEFIEHSFPTPSYAYLVSLEDSEIEDSNKLVPKVYLEVPAKLTFDMEKLPAKPVVTLSVSNQGEGILLISSISSEMDWLEGVEPSEPISIAPQTSKSLDLVLSLDKVKLQGGKLSLEGNILLKCNDPKQPELKETVSLTLVRHYAEFKARCESLKSLEYGKQALVSLMVSNDGNDFMQVEEVKSLDNYVQLPNLPDLPLEVGAGDSTTFKVKIDSLEIPSEKVSEGTVSSMVFIKANDRDDPHQVPIQIERLYVPKIQLKAKVPAEIDYYSAQALELQVSNSGQAPLVIEKIVSNVQWLRPLDWEERLTIAPGEKTNVDLPLDMAYFVENKSYSNLEAEVVVISNDPINKKMVTPIRLGRLLLPMIEASLSTIDPLEYGQSKTFTLTIFNKGEGTLSVANIEIGASWCTLATQAYPLILPADEHCEISFSIEVKDDFEKGECLELSDHLIILSNDPLNPRKDIVIRAEVLSPAFIDLELVGKREDTIVQGSEMSFELIIKNMGKSELKDIEIEMDEWMQISSEVRQDLTIPGKEQYVCPIIARIDKEIPVGELTGHILVRSSSAPDESSIDVKLMVKSQGIIEIPESVSVRLELATEQEIEIPVKNVGGSTLIIKSVISEDAWMVVEPMEQPLKIAPGDQTVIKVRIFGLDKNGKYKTTVEIIPNDTRVSSAKTTVLVTALYPGKIAVKMERIIRPIFGEITTTKLTVTNEGDLPLTINNILVPEWIKLKSFSKPLTLEISEKQELTLKISTEKLTLDQEGKVAGQLVFETDNLRQPDYPLDFVVQPIQKGRLRAKESITFEATKDCIQGMLLLINDGDLPITLSSIKKKPEWFDLPWELPLTLEGHRTIELPYSILGKDMIPEGAEEAKVADVIQLSVEEGEVLFCDIEVSGRFIAAPCKLECRLDELESIVRGTPQELKLTIINKGSQKLTVSGIEVDQPWLLVDFPGDNLVVKAAKTKKVNINIDGNKIPGDLNFISATIIVHSNDKENPSFPVNLNAVVKNPARLLVTPISVSVSGYSKKKQTTKLEVRNKGDIDLEISSIRCDKPWLDVRVSDLPVIISPGELSSWDVEIDLSNIPLKDSERDFAATIEIQSNDPVSSIMEVPVVCKMTFGPQVNAETVADSQQFVYGQENTITLKIKNTGTDQLEISAINFDQPWLDTKTISTPLSVTPQAEESLKIKFNYAILRKKGPGQIHGSFHITSNDSITPEYEVPCSFKVPGPPSLVTENVDFGEIKLGDEVEKELELANEGESLLIVEQVNCEHPAVTISYNKPLSIALGKKQKIKLKIDTKEIDTATSRQFENTFLIQSNDINAAFRKIGLRASVLLLPVLDVDIPKMVLVRPAEAISFEVAISNRGDQDLKVNNIKSEPSSLKIDLPKIPFIIKGKETFKLVANGDPQGILSKEISKGFPVSLIVESNCSMNPKLERKVILKAPRKPFGVKKLLIPMASAAVLVLGFLATGKFLADKKAQETFAALQNNYEKLIQNEFNNLKFQDFVAVCDSFIQNQNIENVKFSDLLKKWDKFLQDRGKKEKYKLNVKTMREQIAKVSDSQQKSDSLFSNAMATNNMEGVIKELEEMQKLYSNLLEKNFNFTFLINGNKQLQLVHYLCLVL